MSKPIRPGPTLFGTDLALASRSRTRHLPNPRPRSRPRPPSHPPRRRQTARATAGRDRHAAGSPGHPVRWADSRRAALERAARDRARRPRGRRGRPARRAAPALIGGTIVHIAPPKRFAKPGRVTLELGQLVQAGPGRSELVPWVFDLEDRRFNVQMRRRLMLALFAAEGAGIGASLGARRPGHRVPRTWGLERGWACSRALDTPA